MAGFRIDPDSGERIYDAAAPAPAMPEPPPARPPEDSRGGWVGDFLGGPNTALPFTPTTPKPQTAPEIPAANLGARL